MKKQTIALPGTLPDHSAGTARALWIVGSVESDGGRDSVFDQFSWRTYRVRSRLEFVRHVHDNRPRVVVCERDLPDGDWRDVLAATSSLPSPPPLIVASRLADEHLWAEVLNLGGYDVLAKPLDKQEVGRTLKLAWDRWANQQCPVL